MIMLRNKYGQSTYVAFLDFACAFDSLCRERIYDLPRADGVSGKTVRLIKDTNSNTTATVRARAGTSRKILADAGVRQGSVLGPMLFNYVIDEVMRRATQDYVSNILLYSAEEELTRLECADDIALVADNPRKLQKAVTAASDNSASFGLLLKPTKSKVLATKPSKLMRFPIRIDGEELENIISFCYLGPLITAGTSCVEDISQQTAKASIAFSMMQKCLWNTKIKNNTKLRVYWTAIRPMLMYGSSKCSLTKAAEGALDAAERKFLRHVLE
ncbi:hypothetical protein AB6A40_007254 [Gnathostoma spinigerum]|uniref:Reverse transcriptase domain-containing protein n=1 Tax=Gnathostoma spinigerum TaxID=75299 RepID=A0ABD6ELX3_9BILA